uniref:Uncharacterized protein n=1 Tax=Tanacetum cinerariifolium TaxID=118510 RepID=A0A6L2N8M1_TANCI|nr:hypothetical protein [Tanacetum cinerariifolium]
MQPNTYIYGNDTKLGMSRGEAERKLTPMDAMIDKLTGARKVTEARKVPKMIMQHWVTKLSFPLFLSSLSSSNPPTIDSTQAFSSNPSKKIKLTIIPPRKLFVNISSDEDVTTTPSHITTSFSPSPPNTPSKTLSTKDTSSTFGTTYSSFESKPQSSPLTSNDTPSPQPSNPFHENVMDAPPRPSHLLPLQSHPFLDITFSLSPITPLDHILDTPSLPSPQPQPQPPLMRHPFTSTIVTTMDQLVFVVFTTAILSFLLGMR